MEVSIIGEIICSMEYLTSVVELGLGSTDPYTNLFHSPLLGHISFEVYGCSLNWIQLLTSQALYIPVSNVNEIILKLSS